MASLADVANEVRGLLEEVRDNTGSTASRVEQTNTKLDDLNSKIDTLVGVNQAGFANLSSGIAVMIDRQDATNHLLDANRRQNDTMICWLTTIAELLCRHLHRLDTQVELQRLLAEKLTLLTAVAELVNPREFIEVGHRDDLAARIERCCPPEPEQPEPCYDGCPKPDYQPHHPTDTDWKPLPQPEPTGPVG